MKALHTVCLSVYSICDLFPIGKVTLVLFIQIHEAVLNQPDHCTVLLISNKMDVIKNADHIIYLDDGVVKEEGSHDELLKLGGYYADLVEKQNTAFHRQEQTK